MKTSGKITKTRIKDGSNIHRGTVFFAVDCETEGLCDVVTNLINGAGFDTPIHEESDKFEDGLCIIVSMSSDEIGLFNSEYKKIKQAMK